jgi:transcriptional regulator with XRE-family HTH domain
MATRVIRVRLSRLEQDFSLRSLLLASDLGTAQFARALGVARETVSRMCGGKRPSPRHLLLAALTVCQAAGCAIIYEDPARELSAVTNPPEEIAPT